MSVTSRIAADDDGMVDYARCPRVNGISRVMYIWKMRSKFRVYEDGSYYSQTSGGVTKRGRVLRDADGKPKTFATVDDAKAWVEGGCRVW